MARRSKTKLDWWHSLNQLMVMLGVGLGFGIYGPSLLDLADIYSTTTETVAIMNSARAVGMFLGSCFGGMLYNHMNDQILTLIFLIIYGIGTVITPLLPNVICLHICGTIAGISFGISHIGSQVRLVKIWSDKSASAIQAFHGAWGIGSMLGPFVVVPFLSVREGDIITKEQRLYIPYGLFGIFYVLMSASMIAAYFVDPKSIEKPKDEEKDEDDSTSKKSEYVIIALLFSYITICCNTEHSFGTFIPVYASESKELHFTLANSALLAGTYWATFTGGRIIGVFAAMICNLRLLLLICHALLISASAIMIVFNSSALCAWIGTAIMGVGVSSLYGSASGLVFEYIRIRHSYVGAILTASCLGLAVSAYAVPPFITTWPMFLQYYIGGGHILNTICLVLIFLALRGRDKIFDAPTVFNSRRGSRYSSHGF